jgi:hypothetical protein
MDTTEFVTSTAADIAYSIEEAWQEEWAERGSNPDEYAAGLAEFRTAVITQLPSPA